MHVAGCMQTTGAVSAAWQRMPVKRFLESVCDVSDQGDGVSKKIFSKMGVTDDEAVIALIVKNPYRWLYKIGGVSFEQTDSLYLQNPKFGGSRHDDVRLDALIGVVVGRCCRESGDCHVPCNELLDPLERADKELSLTKVRDYVFKTDPNTTEFFRRDADLFYPPSVYWAEQHLPSQLYRFMHRRDSDADVMDVETDDDVEEDAPLDAGQASAVTACVRGGLALVTGLAGAGKTEVITRVCRRLDRKRVGIVLLAPTGTASEVIAQRTGRQASTIHYFVACRRYAKANPEATLEDDESAFFSYVTLCTSTDPVFVIVDEASMVSSVLLCTLLSVLPPNVAGLLLFGDYHQLPPIDPGEPFKVLCTTPAFQPWVHTLTQNHRQKGEGQAIDNLRRIALSGLVPAAVPGVLLREEYPHDRFDQPAADKICGMVVHLGVADTQVIAPTNLMCGYLSNALQAAENPDAAPACLPVGTKVLVYRRGSAGRLVFKIGHVEALPLPLPPASDDTAMGAYKVRLYSTQELESRYRYELRPFGLEMGFSVGDRVMMTCNSSFGDGEDVVRVVNGTQGTLVGPGPESKSQSNSRRKCEPRVRVQFPNGTVLCPLKDLRLAYCITVHKYQGRQKPNIVFVADGFIPDRRLAYTASTRFSRRLVTIVPRGCAWKYASSLRKAIRARKTHLAERLARLVAAKGNADSDEGDTANPWPDSDDDAWQF